MQLMDGRAGYTQARKCGRWEIQDWKFCPEPAPVDRSGFFDDLSQASGAKSWIMNPTPKSPPTPFSRGSGLDCRPVLSAQPATQHLANRTDLPSRSTTASVSPISVLPGEPPLEFRRPRPVAPGDRSRRRPGRSRAGLHAHANPPGYPRQPR